MFQIRKYKNISIALVCAWAMLFLSCKDNYQRVGDEAIPKVYPQGTAKDGMLIYSKTVALKSDDAGIAKIVAVVKTPVMQDFENLSFKRRVFPEGLEITFYDDDNKKSIITADYGVVYINTDIVDLQGNVVIKTHDGKILESPQMYWDRVNSWIFTKEKFTYTNPEDNSVLDGEGMDFNKEFSFLSAHKTYGILTLNEKE